MYCTDGSDCLNLDLDRNIATVIVNSVCLVITTASLAYIFRRRTDDLMGLESEESEDSSQPVIRSGLCSNSKLFLEDRGVQHFPQVFRHSLLLLLMMTSMIADLTLPVWSLATQSLHTNTGTYKVMLSLDVILTTGQGLLIFSIFILDCQYILNPVISVTRKVKKKLSVGSSQLLVT